MNQISKNLRIYQKLAQLLWTEDFNLRLRLIASVLLLIFSIGFNVFTPLVIRHIGNELDSKMFVITQIQLLLIAYGIAWTIGKGSQQLRELVVYRVFERAIHLLSLRLFNHLHLMSYQHHVNRKTGSIASVITQAQKGLPEIFWWGCFYIIPTFIEIFIATFILYKLYDIQYSLILVSTLLAYVCFNLYSSKWTIEALHQSNKQASQTLSLIIDSLMNFESVKAFNTFEKETKKCEVSLQKQEDAFVQRRTRMTIVQACQNIIMGAGLTLAMWNAGQGVIQGHLTVSDLFLINIYILQFITPLALLGNIFRRMREGLSHIQQVMDHLEIMPDILDLPNAQDLSLTCGEIVLENVSFSYDSRSILKNISLRIPAGKTIAIVGSTGSGKSTLARLLMRLYEVKEGKILIDGQDIQKVTQTSLRRAITFIPQDVTLFNHTIQYNMTYGTQQNADVDTLVNLAQLACLDELVHSLPQKFQTEIGERGLKLSGGERQRIAIARALFKQSPIYILDESTSSLDMYTERKIVSNLNNHTLGTTKIIIAHRLSTIVFSDEIIVLHNGKIVEQGKHDALINKNGLYTSMWQKQLNESSTTITEEVV